MLFALEVSSRNSDSGVVTRISGGWLTILRRCSGVESPLRMATSTSGMAAPSPHTAGKFPAWQFKVLRHISAKAPSEAKCIALLTPRFVFLREPFPAAFLFRMALGCRDFAMNIHSCGTRPARHKPVKSRKERTKGFYPTLWAPQRARSRRNGWPATPAAGLQWAD